MKTFRNLIPLAILVLLGTSGCGKKQVAAVPATAGRAANRVAALSASASTMRLNLVLNEFLARE